MLGHRLMGAPLVLGVEVINGGSFLLHLLIFHAYLKFLTGKKAWHEIVDSSAYAGTPKYLRICREGLTVLLDARLQERGEVNLDQEQLC